MAEQPDVPAPPPEASQAEQDRKKKKKDKVRSAWISFTGRIIAQILGAAATIVLGLLIARQYQGNAGKDPAGPSTDPQRTSRADRPRSPGETALAVLPLENLSGDPQQEYFADGMSDALITDLSRIDGLRVISKTSSMYYKGQRKPLPEIAQELGVDLVVEGSVMKAGERVRITVQLIDANTDEHLWANKYDRSLRDVLSIQAEVATAIAQEVKVALNPNEATRRTERRPVDPAVYDLYLLGRHSWSLRTVDGFQDAIRLFRQAIEKDPEFALAYAGLADTYSFLGTAGYSTPAVPGGMVQAKAAAKRALALDDSLAEGHTSLGRVLYYYDWDWPGAESEYRRALALNPGYATAHQWYATLLSEQGRDQEAIPEAQRAVTLDPLSAIMHMTLASVHFNGRRFDLAVASGRRALELDPNALAPRLILAGCFMARGDARAAIEVCQQAPSPPHPLILATLSAAYSRAGEQERAIAFRRQLLSRPNVSSAALVRLYAGWAEPDPFFAALDRAVAQRSDIIPRLRVSPLFDAVRSDSRFLALLNRVKLLN